MNVLAPQITQTKALRDRMINYLASFLPNTPLPPPPGIPANVLADPGTWRGAGREALNFLVPQPEDTLMGLMKPTFRAYHGSPISGLKNLEIGPGGEYQRIEGIYGTENFDNALKYTRQHGELNPSNVYPIEITLNNPADRNILDSLGYQLNGKQMRNKLIEMGYDGVNDNFMDEIIAFYPNQVKIVK